MSFADNMAAGLVPIYAEFGDAATWSDVALAVTVIREEGQRDVSPMHGGRRVRLDAVMISVRSSEVPAPKAGDVVNITAGPALGRRYQLLDDSEPELDELGLEWTCEAERIDDR